VTAPSAFFGSALLAPGRGGIARVARMTARALAQSDAARLEAASFLDTRVMQIDRLRAAPAYGSKALFALLAHRGARRASHALYDCVGVARAHPRSWLTPPPFAVWMHGIECWEALTGDRRAAARRARLVIVNSQATLDRHQSLHGPLETARVCWLATEQDEPPESRAGFAGPPRVLIVGRIEASECRKGHHELIDVWPQVVAAVPDARLAICGGGAGLAAFRETVAASPAARSIDVLGHVAEEALPALYVNAHVYAMPSRQEGFGVAYVEAMRFGLPVVASLDDAGREVNVDGVTGYNLRAGDRTTLCETLVALLRAPDLCAKLGEAGFDRWRENFRYSCFAKRFLDIWTDFTRAGGSHG
jgi:phosphatidylinositol alpha-1,6-mannosyltransferase